MIRRDVHQVALSRNDTDQKPDPHNQQQSRCLPTAMAWMPLEGVAQRWATFAGTFFSQAAFMATSMACSALALEAGALRQYGETCRHRYNGESQAARSGCEQTIQNLQESSSQWTRALFWLEQVAADSQHSQEEQAAIRTLFSETTEQVQRLSLLTFQVQEAAVVLYQRTGLLIETRGNVDA